jgi:hypothetical protein
VDTAPLLAAVHQLAWVDTGPLRCAETGHPAGHVCLPVPPGTDVSVLRKDLSDRYGRSRPLVTDGRLDPAATERTGLPLLEPFGRRPVHLHAWACRGRWIGCGATTTAPVLVVAERPDPGAAGLPDDATWVDRVVAVTGWQPGRAQPIGWSAVEDRLGTALPGDYRRLADVFGFGAFDAYLQLHVPDAAFPGFDLTEQAFPAPDRLLLWATSEQGDRFHWLTESTDPDRWPVLATEDDHRVWHRFDGSTAEYVHRVLTDPGHPFSTARYFDIHWYFRY